MEAVEFADLLRRSGEIYVDHLLTGDRVVVQVPGGELIFFDLTNHGSGEWYFNDTAD